MKYFNHEDPDRLEHTFLNAYTTSLYWAITTLVTVGYGDITPYTKVERIYAILYMIICGFVFAFIMGNVTDIIQEYYEETKKF